MGGKTRVLSQIVEQLIERSACGHACEAVDGVVHGTGIEAAESTQRKQHVRAAAGRRRLQSPPGPLTRCRLCPLPYAGNKKPLGNLRQGLVLMAGRRRPRGAAAAGGAREPSASAMELARRTVKPRPTKCRISGSKPLSWRCPFTAMRSRP